MLARRVHEAVLPAGAGLTALGMAAIIASPAVALSYALSPSGASPIEPVLIQAGACLFAGAGLLSLGVVLLTIGASMEYEVSA